MEASKMESLKVLMGKDKEASVVWHTLQVDHKFDLPLHNDYAAYIVLSDGKVKAFVSGQEEDYDLHDGMAIIASPKGTSMELHNVDKKGVDFFVLKTH
jgi:hypothetical protein